VIIGTLFINADFEREEITDTFDKTSEMSLSSLPESKLSEVRPYCS
jgi:hypothetical protein